MTYPARTLEFPSGTPSIASDVLTLGGRRGFLSGVLVARDLGRDAGAEHLAGLIRHATSTACAQGAAWWWPYLISSEVDVVMAAGNRLGGRAGPGVHLVGADCVIDVVGTTVDDHVAALPTRQRRTNFRREEKRFIDSGLEVRRVSLPEYWPHLGPLLAAVRRRDQLPEGHDRDHLEPAGPGRTGGLCRAGGARRGAGTEG